MVPSTPLSPFQTDLRLASRFDWLTTFSDSTRVDFRNPESFYHDVNSVAGLLKLFFRELPDPLLTRANYSRFIEAARESLSIESSRRALLD